MSRTTKLLGLALLLVAGRASAQQTMPQPPVAQGVTSHLETQVIPTTSPFTGAPSGNPVPIFSNVPDLPGSDPLARPPQGGPALTPDGSPILFQRDMFSRPQDLYPGVPDESLSVTPPGFEAIFNHLDSEAGLDERIRQGKRETEPGTRIIFPEEPVVSTTDYMGRKWPRRAVFAEPNYVIYDRLYFEDLNSERYGWDLGFIGPFVSTGYFAKDLLLFPMHAGTDIFRTHESNAGYALPGDNVPYLLYPPEVSLTGAALEAAAAVTLMVVFP